MSITFTERYSFLRGNAKQTNRLKDHIIDVSPETNSVAATEALGHNAIKTSKCTICLILKNRYPYGQKITKKKMQMLLSANFIIPKQDSYYEGTADNSRYWEAKTPPDAVETTHEKNWKRKQELVEQVQKPETADTKRAVIAKETGLSYTTIKRYYFNPKFFANNAGYG